MTVAYLLRHLYRCMYALYVSFTKRDTNPSYLHLPSEGRSRQNVSCRCQSLIVNLKLL